MKQKTQKNKKSEIDKALVIQAIAAISSVNERRIEKMNKEKTVERKNQKKLNERGITLVALVITIIIIIILATVTINFTFGEGGIIEQAELAKEMSESSTNTEALLMSNLTAYLEEEFQEPGEDEPVTPPGPTMPAEWDQTKVTPVLSKDNIYVPVPKGFTASKADGEQSVNSGFVIYEGETDVNNDNVAEAQQSRNQFVWIPVSDADLAEMYSTTTPESASDTTLSKSSLGEAATTTKIYSKLRVRSGDSSSYTAGAPGSTNAREPDILTSTSYGDASTTKGINLIKSELGYTGSNAEILKNFAQDMVDEYLAVFESIKQYDGFYIGRYELTGTASNPTVQRHQPVLTADDKTGANTWYGLKDASNRVVTGEGKHAQSYMIYGNQWDEVMDWLVDTGAKTSDEVNVNSSNWGNYSDYVQITTRAPEPANPKNSGSNDDWKANNIYDLAGNYADWTQEAGDTSYRVDRGGYSYNSGSSGPASDRDNYSPYNTNSSYSCRPALYIKSSTET